MKVRSALAGDAARRRALLMAALGFTRLEVRDAPEPPVLRTPKTWLGSWRGVDLIAVNRRAI